MMFFGHCDRRRSPARGYAACPPAGDLASSGMASTWSAGTPAKPRPPRHGLAGGGSRESWGFIQYLMSLVISIPVHVTLKQSLFQSEFLLFHQAVQGQPAHINGGWTHTCCRDYPGHQQPLHASAAVPIKNTRLSPPCMHKIEDCRRDPLVSPHRFRGLKYLS